MTLCTQSPIPSSYLPKESIICSRSVHNATRVFSGQYMDLSAKNLSSLRVQGVCFWLCRSYVPLSNVLRLFIPLFQAEMLRRVSYHSQLIAAETAWDVIYVSILCLSQIKYTSQVDETCPSSSSRGTLPSIITSSIRCVKTHGQFEHDHFPTGQFPTPTIPLTYLNTDVYPHWIYIQYKTDSIQFIQFYLQLDKLW